MSATPSSSGARHRHSHGGGRRNRDVSGGEIKHTEEIIMTEEAKKR
jgi:hypothetical protein